MIWAEAFISILRVTAYKNMPHFRMGQAMHQLAPDYRTGSNPCTDRNIKTTVQPLSRTPCVFS
ncbi:hypothetical protein D3C75_1387460 [compost metagenome]